MADHWRKHDDPVLQLDGERVITACTMAAIIFGCIGWVIGFVMGKVF